MVGTASGLYKICSPSPPGGNKSKRRGREGKMKEKGKEESKGKGEG